MAFAQKEVLVGEIVEVGKDNPGFYRVRVTSTEGGATLNAKHAPPIPNMGSILEQGQRIIGVMGSDDVFYIIATIPEGYKGSDKKRRSTMPGHTAMDHGDAFFGSHDNGSGMMIGLDGVINTTACVAPDDEGATHLMIPGLAAIRNLCRRFQVQSAAGDINCYHDDISGRTAMAFWARPFRLPGLDGKNARIHLGWHDDIPNAMFSVTVYPIGLDVKEKAASLNMQSIIQGLKREVVEYGGQKKLQKDERKDWQTRLYITSTGETVFESAPIFVPNVATTATPTIKVSSNSLTGEIKTTTIGMLDTTALNAAIKLATSYTLTAATATITAPIARIIATGMFGVETAYAKINSPQISLGSDALSAQLRQLVKEQVYDYLQQFSIEYNAHTHPVAGTTTTPPAKIIATLEATYPKEIGLTQNVKAV